MAANDPSNPTANNPVKAPSHKDGSSMYLIISIRSDGEPNTQIAFNAADETAVSYSVFKQYFIYLVNKIYFRKKLCFYSFYFMLLFSIIRERSFYLLFFLFILF